MIAAMTGEKKRTPKTLSPHKCVPKGPGDTPYEQRLAKVRKGSEMFGPDPLIRFVAGQVGHATGEVEQIGYQLNDDEQITEAQFNAR